MDDQWYTMGNKRLMLIRGERYMRRMKLSEISSLSFPEKMAISKLKDKMNSEFHVEKLILFGSKARGDYTETSDVDLIVLVKEPKTPEIRQKLSELQFEVIMEQDAPIITLLENYDNWISETGVSLPLKDSIESEGVEIEI